ncbi:tetraacyldisaccharide 4'-kinase, partial [bacterium]|nr:tetraacyldisaccharide 4'-kinase [bacterium]
IVSNGEKVNVTAKQAGDEPMFLAKNLSEIPVIVGKDRAKTGYLAVHTWKTDILLLDDAFQNRKLKKDLDLVVIDSTNLWGNGKILPAGPLREPLNSLKRADGIILTRASESSLNNKGEKCIRKFTDAQIFSATHEPRNFISLQDGRTCKLNILKGKKVLGFSGIGNPDSFEKILQSIDVRLLDLIVFRDHYWYKPKDLERILKIAETRKADALVTTEKDYVRLPLDWCPLIPTYYLKIEFEMQKGFEELKSLLDSIFISEKSREA